MYIYIYIYIKSNTPTKLNPLAQAESLLMSAFHNGQLRTMKANYTAQV